MASVQEIDRAIGAHGLWKTKLRGAIASGSFASSVLEVRADDRCEFGKWLHGTSITAVAKASPAYADVKRLHAEFHKQAANVVSAAIAGRREEAEASMAMSGAFSQASTRLTAAMKSWKADLASR